MVQQYKVEKVEYLKEKFDSNKCYVFNNYSGLDVDKITELRGELRKLNSSFVVIKNNYIKRILKDKKLPEMDESLAGPTAVAFTDDDVSEVLKTLFNFSKNSTLEVKGGWADDKIFSAEELNELSKLPGRNQLIAMLMSTMNAPMQNFVYSCNDIIGRLVRVVNAVAEQKK